MHIQKCWWNIFFDSWLGRWKRALVTQGRWWFPLPKKNTLTSSSAAAVGWENSGGHLRGPLATTSSTILMCPLSCVVIWVTKTKYKTRSDVIAAQNRIENCENTGNSGLWSPNMRRWVYKSRVCYKEDEPQAKCKLQSISLYNIHASGICTTFATCIMLQSYKSDYLHWYIYSILYFYALILANLNTCFSCLYQCHIFLLFNVTELIKI